MVMLLLPKNISLNLSKYLVLLQLFVVLYIATYVQTESTDTLDIVSVPAEDYVTTSIPQDAINNESVVTSQCDAFFAEYTKAVGNFTNCELDHSRPFRLCSQCIKQYEIVSAIFRDLQEIKELDECRRKYLKADRVQIIPTLQANIQALWQDANCGGCHSDVHIDHETRDVNFTIPEDIQQFLLLYHNFSSCVNLSDEIDPNGVLTLKEDSGNRSTLCGTCKERYVKLNKLYNTMSDNTGGVICMDMVDMMNYTRQVWSSHLNCTHRTGDALPVIIITLVVGTTPILFYVTLRITGKERRKKLFKQKRLGANQDTMSTASQSSYIAARAAAGDSNTVPQRLAPFS